MKVVLPERYQALMEEVDRLVATLSKRYPRVVQLAEIRGCFEEGEFFIQISLTGAERAERILRSVAWDLPPEVREEAREVVRRWDECLS
jgi:hypothetical protein